MSGAYRHVHAAPRVAVTAGASATTRRSCGSSRLSRAPPGTIRLDNRRPLPRHHRRALRVAAAGKDFYRVLGVDRGATDQRFLDKVAAAIEENMGNEFFSVEDLAAAVHFSRSQLHRKLKSLIGKSPTDLIREFRLCRAKELLEQKSGNVSEIALEVGYSSLSYFTRSFKAAFGVLPSEV